MTSWTRSEYATIVAAEKSILILPKYYHWDFTKMGVIYCHGSGGDAYEANIINNTSMPPILNAIVENGNPVLSCDFGLNSWGNDATIAKVTSAVNYLQGAGGAKAGKVAFVGESMGGVTSMNWVSQNMAKTACVVGTIPVCDLNDIYGNASYTAAINSAYGGTYNNATNGPTHNPLMMAQAAKFAGLPWQGYTISDDVVATYSKVQAMGTAIGASATVITLPGTGGHGWPTVAKINPQDIVNFLVSNGA